MITDSSVDNFPIKYKTGDLFSSEERECKLYVVNKIDTPLIEKFSLELSPQDKRSLTYFGLAGSSLTDLIHWKDYIKRAVSIENCTNVYHQQIRTLFSDKQLDSFAFSKDISILLGDIDDVLDSTHKNYLKNNDIVNSFLPFTLINLDYYGTVIHTSDFGIMKRVELLKNLFKIQYEKNKKIQYLLLLTIFHSGDDRIPGTEDSQLVDKIKHYGWDKYKEISEKIIKSNKRIPILSLAVPLFIAAAASDNHTRLNVLKKITYRDSKYYMLHFIFKLEGVHEQAPDILKKNIFKEIELEEVKKQGDKIIINNYF